MSRALVLAGPSAGGKTTVAKALIEKHPEFSLVRSVTSRPPRGDAYDDEYIYVTDGEFQKKIDDGDVLEYTEYAGARYGTLKSEVERIEASGKIPLLVLDLNGVKSVAEADGISVCSVYIYDDIRVVDQRLYDRYLGVSPSAEGLKKYVRRKEQNNADFLAAGEFEKYFYAFLKNSKTPENSADELFDIFAVFTAGKERNKDEILLAIDFMLSSLRAAYN